MVPLGWVIGAPLLGYLADRVGRRKPVLLAHNGIAGYGDRGDTVLTEDSPTDADTFVGAVNPGSTDEGWNV